MLDRILMTVGIVLYAVAVPYLEINATHVFNPDWVAHARLHEVWQLATNSVLGLLCLWWVWGPPRRRVLPSLVALSVTGGFLFANVIQGLYGGSMVHPDGSEKLALGVNVGLLGFGSVVLSSLWTLVRGLLTEDAPILRDQGAVLAVRESSRPWLC